MTDKVNLRADNLQVTGSLQVTGTISGGGIQALARTPVVSMTAAASGSSGITVADDDDIDFGTADFTIHWEGALPDWSITSTGADLWFKYQNADNRVAARLQSTGEMRVIARAGAVSVIDEISTASVETVLTAGQNARFTYVCTRQTASVAGSVAFYINGALFDTQAIPAAATVSISNTGQGNISCAGTTGDARLASTTRACYLYNRALSAAEVASLCINGVPFADVGASQTAVYTSDFTSTIDGWTTGGIRTLTANQTINGTAGWLQLNRSSGGSTTWNMVRDVTFTAAQVAKNATIRLTLWRPAATTEFSYVAFDGQTGAVELPADTEVTVTIPLVVASTTLTLRATNSAGVADATVANGQSIYIKSAVIIQAGCTLQLDAENAQWDTGQIFDTSGNKNHGMLPATGATVLPRKTRFEVRGTNTWTGTQELQYIGGVNQAILPANAFIETIAVKVTGADVHDVFVGDGADVDRYVVISGGGGGHGGVAMTVGSYTLPIANHATDGTNLKLTVDPDTDCTMTIAWVITYYTME
jgi:hypothetical protein